MRMQRPAGTLPVSWAVGVDSALHSPPPAPLGSTAVLAAGFALAMPRWPLSLRAAHPAKARSRQQPRAPSPPSCPAHIAERLPGIARFPCRWGFC